MEGRLQAAERGGREGRRCPQGMMLSVSACSATSTFPASVVHCSWSSSATGLLGEAMGKKHGLGLDTWLQGWEDYRQSSQSSLRPFICTWSFCGASEHPQGAGRRPYRGHSKSSMRKALLSAQSYFPLSLLLPLPHPCRQENPENTWLGILLGTGGG